ncbi:MAG TPA: hypothetical protein VE861_16580, partial [Gemmatimonadaceae bacterium]|nr:hypothetical protein [Gemmatimonadaceae bacterium]
VARGIPLPLGAIDNARSLVALDSLVDFLLRCATHEAAAGRVLLVSDGEDVSTPELVRRIGLALHRPARLIPVPTALLQLTGALTGRGAVVRRLLESLQVDSVPSHTLLQWTPPLTLDQGLRRAVTAVRRTPS